MGMYPLRTEWVGTWPLAYIGYAQACTHSEGSEWVHGCVGTRARRRKWVGTRCTEGSGWVSTRMGGYMGLRGWGTCGWVHATSLGWVGPGRAGLARPVWFHSARDGVQGSVPTPRVG
eukprot:gene10302-biopygen4768